MAMDTKSEEDFRVRAGDPSAMRTQRSHSTVQVPFELSEFSTAATPFLHYKTSDFLYDLRLCPFKRRHDGFKKQLLDRWYVAREKKVFNYDLNCVYKLLDGEYDLSFQLNVERGTLRRKPMRFKNIRQPFDHLRFNFTKLKRAELLFHLRCLDRAYAADKLDLLHTLAVNASPLEKGHSLIIPSVNKCFPQVLNETAIRIATDLMLLVEDDTFHVMFNSLLGQASVNHLHLHTIFWPYESGLVTRKCEFLCENVFIVRRPIWFIQAFVFQLRDPNDFDQFIRRLAKCAAFLTNENVAHNLFMSRAPPIQTEEGNNLDADESNSTVKPQYVTAYLFPRRNQTGAKPPTNFNPASVELAGFLTAYTYRFFDSATEQTALRIIDEDAVLSDDVFDALADALVRRYSGEVAWQEIECEGELVRREVSLFFAAKSGVETAPPPQCHSSLSALNVVTRQQQIRRYSQCLSENGSFTSESPCCEEFSQLDLKNYDTHELDELSDSFHTITSPVPQLRHYHSFGSPGCSSLLSGHDSPIPKIITPMTTAKNNENSKNNNLESEGRGG